MRHCLLAVILLSMDCAAAVEVCVPQSSAETHAASQSSQVDIVGCLSEQAGEFKLTDDEGNVYELIGHKVGLRKHIGDELDVTGTEEHPPSTSNDHPASDTPLRVTKIETVLHMNPSGVAPVLGDAANWSSYANSNYGLYFRYPKTFDASEDGSTEANFADWEKGSAVHIKSFVMPQSIYPDANYQGGQLTAFVDSNIRSEGTCRQFNSFLPEHTSSRTVRGITYAQTASGDAGAGHIATVYYFHTFQHGLCYELDFTFEGHNTTGMPLPCSNQWVSEQNEFQLMDALLSDVKFLSPHATLATVQRPSGTPTVVSFTHSRVIVDLMNNVEVSWSTERADYVQLHYQCVASVFVSEATRGGNIPCGAVVDRNFPADGTTSLALQNLTPASVQLVITVEPFSDGRGYAENSKTITIPVTPLSSLRKEK
jgi:hypothetical protein